MTFTGRVNDGEVRVKGYPVWSRSTKKGHKLATATPTTTIKVEEGIFQANRSQAKGEIFASQSKKEKKKKKKKMKMHREEQKKKKKKKNAQRDTNT